MDHWVYHPIQKPQIVSDVEYPAYLENGWYKNYSEIPGYKPDENGENVNDSDEYCAQVEDIEQAVKKRGRPPKKKSNISEPVPILNVDEETQRDQGE